jgi:hypothetical protein
VPVSSQQSLFDPAIQNAYQQSYQAPVSKFEDLRLFYWMAGGAVALLLVMIAGVTVYRTLANSKPAALRPVASVQQTPVVGGNDKSAPTRPPSPPPNPAFTQPPQLNPTRPESPPILPTAPPPNLTIPESPPSNPEVPTAPPSAPVNSTSPTIAQIPTTEIVDGWTRSVTIDGRFEFFTPAVVVASTHDRFMRSISKLKINSREVTQLTVEFSYLQKGFSLDFDEKVMKRVVPSMLEHEFYENVSINRITTNGQLRLQMLARKDRRLSERTEICLFDKGTLRVLMKCQRINGQITDADEKRFFDSLNMLK